MVAQLEVVDIGQKRCRWGFGILGCGRAWWGHLIEGRKKVGLLLRNGLWLGVRPFLVSSYSNPALRPSSQLESFQRSRQQAPFHDQDQIYAEFV